MASFASEETRGHGAYYLQVKNEHIDTALKAFTPGTPIAVSLGQDGYDRHYNHVRGTFAVGSW